MPQFIYTMKGLGKVHPPDHVVLKDIWLSFLPGAKIGVLGLNGAGKSSLLRIMAGEDQQFIGEALPAEGITRRLPAAGAAARSDEDRARQRRGRRRRDQGAARRATTRSTRSSARTCRPRRWTRSSRSRARSRTGSRRRTRGTSTRGSSSRWTRCACRRPTPTSRRCRAASAAASRCAGCCCKSPDLLLLDEPTNHLDAESVAWLERFLKDYPGTVVAVTHDRYFLDNVAGWILELDRGHGIPWEGNYSSWLEQKQNRLAQEEKAETKRQRTLAARAGVDPHVAARAAGEGQGAPERVRGAAEGRDGAEDRPGRDLHPARPAARRHRRRGARPAEGATATSC